jgi:hypothetical protein
MRSRTILSVLCIVALFAIPASAQSGMQIGKADLQSAGILAFGTDGVLFVGDSMGAAIYALDTGDNTAGAAQRVDIQGIDMQVAAMLGTAPDQILINDMAVNPISKNVYLSVSRGTGPDAMPVILRVTASGSIDELSLGNIAHSKVILPNAPAGGGQASRARLQTITDLAFADGKVFIAGLSNEEFSSKLRSIPFPFENINEGTSVEIFHGNHGRLETNSPVRTFVPYTIDNEPHILAAYTCTPLVTFPVADLQPGQKILGHTIAELGSGNRPLDMIIYSKGGSDHILMSNSSRGVMKMSAAGLNDYDHIGAPLRASATAGVPYETLDLDDVEQLDQLGAGLALILTRAGSGSVNLQTIALP